MTTPEQEARSLGRYLLGSPPSEYAVLTYCRLEPLAPFKLESWDGFDRALVRTAGWHPVVARVADLHARFFRPHTLLRKKLVLLTAILESSPGSAAALNESGGGMAAAIGSLVWVGLGAALSLVLGCVVFLPVRAWVAVTGRTVRP